MSNYWVKGHCYSSTDGALSAWISLWPNSSYDYQPFIIAYPTISSTGLITFTSRSAALTGLTGASNPVAKSFQLDTCAKPDMPYDYSGGSAIFGFFFIFVLSLYLVSKSAGAIINAVRNM